MNRIWSFISVKICAQYIISIYYWDTTTGQLKEGRSLMREKIIILHARHVRFTGLHMSRTCILQNSARHPRAFYCASHARPPRAFYWTQHAAHVNFLPSSICLPFSFLSRHQTHYDEFSIFFSNLLDAHDNHFPWFWTIYILHNFEQLRDDCSSWKLCFNKTSSFPTTIFSFFCSLRSLLKELKRSNQNYKLISHLVD